MIPIPHFHRPLTRTIEDLQQMFVVQRGVVAVVLYDDGGKLLREAVLRAVDTRSERARKRRDRRDTQNRPDRISYPFSSSRRAPQNAASKRWCCSA